MRAAGYLRVARRVGCCRVGDKFLAITKKCLEVGGYVQRWEDAAGGYRKKVFWGVVHWVPQPVWLLPCFLSEVFPALLSGSTMFHTQNREHSQGAIFVLPLANIHTKPS